MIFANRCFIYKQIKLKDIINKIQQFYLVLKENDEHLLQKCIVTVESFEIVNLFHLC